MSLLEEGNVDPQALARQRKVHETLQATLSLVPSGRSKLVNLLTRNYPHRRLRAEILSDFTLQALRVVQYAPLIEVCLNGISMFHSTWIIIIIG